MRIEHWELSIGLDRTPCVRQEKSIIDHDIKLIAAGPVGTVKKLERLSRRLFQAAVEIHQEEVAEGHLFRISTAAAVSIGLPFRTFLSFLVLFSFFVEIEIPAI
jgi:hypothetical protein